MISAILVGFAFSHALANSPQEVLDRYVSLVNSDPAGDLCEIILPAELREWRLVNEPLFINAIQNAAAVDLRRLVADRIKDRAISSLSDQEFYRLYTYIAEQRRPNGDTLRSPLVKPRFVGSFSREDLTYGVVKLEYPDWGTEFGIVTIVMVVKVDGRHWLRLPGEMRRSLEPLP
jgi:hypothetical protein